MSKKAISAIVVVLLTLAAIFGVIIIFTIIIPSAGKGVNVGFACMNSRLGINTKAGYTCYDPVNKEVKIQISRGPVEYELVNIEVFVLVNGKMEKFEITEDILNVNEERTYPIKLISSSEDVKSVAIAPVIKKQGLQLKCGISARAELNKCV